MSPPRIGNRRIDETSTFLAGARNRREDRASSTKATHDFIAAREAKEEEEEEGKKERKKERKRGPTRIVSGVRGDRNG